MTAPTDDSGSSDLETYWRLRAEYLGERLLRNPPHAHEAIYWTVRDIEALAELAEKADSMLAARLRFHANKAARKKHK